MQIEFYPSTERGTAEHGWLHSKFSFSFADYYNPERMSFGALRVLNEDIIEPAQGFGFHPHDNMEIVTIVLEGALEHRDSLGHHGIIKPGDVQRMSAGTGIVHSEYNHSKTEPVHLLQIWVQTRERNIKPGYEQKSFDLSKIANSFFPVVSGDNNKETLYIHQNAQFLIGCMDDDVKSSYKLTDSKNGLYIFMIKGMATMENKKLKAGDAAAVRNFDSLEITANKKAELLLIEVPLLTIN